jgi:hypothetical protein
MESKEDNDWVMACQWIEVNGKRGRDRGRKMWREFVEEDMKVRGLRAEYAQVKLRWRKVLRGDRLTRASLKWTGVEPVIIIILLFKLTFKSFFPKLCIHVACSLLLCYYFFILLPVCS